MLSGHPGSIPRFTVTVCSITEGKDTKSRLFVALQKARDTKKEKKERKKKEKRTVCSVTEGKEH